MREKRLYKLEVAPHVERSLKKLKRESALLARLDFRIRSLATDPQPPGCKKVRSGKFDNIDRVRAGDWRILYAVEEARVLILMLDVVPHASAYR